MVDKIIKLKRFKDNCIIIKQYIKFLTSTYGQKALLVAIKNFMVLKN